MSDSTYAWTVFEQVLVERKQRRRLIAFIACICFIFFFIRAERSHSRIAVARADSVANNILIGRDVGVKVVKRATEAGTAPEKKRKAPPSPQPAARPPPQRIDWWAEYKERQRNKKLHPPAPNSIHNAQKPLGAGSDDTGKAATSGDAPANNRTVPRRKPFGKPQILVTGKQRPLTAGKVSTSEEKLKSPPKPKQTPDVSTPSRVATKTTSARPSSAGKPKTTPAPVPHIRPPMSHKDDDPRKGKLRKAFFSAVSSWRHKDRTGKPYAKKPFHCKKGCTGQGCCQCKDEVLEEEALKAMPLFMGAHICAHDSEL